MSQSEARGCTGKNAGGGKDPLDGAAANPCDDTVASQVLKEVWTSLAIILSTALSGSFVGRLIAPLVQETLRKKKEGGISVAMSVPELQYILMEYDELKHTTVDYMQTTIQYGYIVLLSAAFPLGPFVALLVNNVQVRTDCYAFIHLYRRVMPSSAEDIGVFEKFFQMLNVAGVVTNAALSVYVSKPFSENKGWSDHNRHNLFIVVVTVGLSFYASCRLLLDAVPPSVEIQVKRQEFIESKIVDREKDFDVHEDLKVASIDYRVHAMDDGAYHTNMLMFDEEDHAPPRTASAVEDRGPRAPRSRLFKGATDATGRAGRARACRPRGVGGRHRCVVAWVLAGWAQASYVRRVPRTPPASEVTMAPEKASSTREPQASATA